MLPHFPFKVIQGPADSIQFEVTYKNEYVNLLPKKLHLQLSLK